MERKDGLAWLGGAAAGAAAMFFLDPRSGRKRRALFRDQVIHTLNVSEEAVGRLSHDATNRARGTVARTKRRVLPQPPVEDPKLEARVRSALGRLTSHPGSIEVHVEDGIVTLAGAILAGEVGDVIAGIRRVPGARRVESALIPLTDQEASAALRAGRPRQAPVPDMLQRHMSPTSRALVGAVGAAITYTGLRRGGLLGFLSAGIGGLFLTRAATNADLKELVGAPAQPSLPVQKCLDVEAPVQEVFGFWSCFHNFPRFMQHLREVRETEGGISHWVADGPAGVPVSWDAEITALQPHRRIAWRSLPGSLIQNVGEVVFDELDLNRTRIQVRMLYHPPAGPLGHAVATLFGADPRKQLDDDLVRFKSLLEDGSTTAHGQEVARQDVSGPPS